MFAMRLGLVLGCIFALGVAAQGADTLLVLSKADQTLAMVDAATMKVLAKMPSGPDPHEVAASADGKLAFISNYGGGAYNTITVVDLVNRKTLQAVDLGPLRGPHGLMFAGGKLWFTAEAAKAIGSYDAASQKVDWILGTGQNRTHMVYVFDDLKRILTTNISSATMSVIDKVAMPPGRGPGRGPREDWDETVIPVGRGAEGFDVSPDRKEIWAANATDGTISIVDVGSKKVSETLTGARVNGANRLKFTPDGKLVFVSLINSPDVVVFDAATRKEVKRIPVGKGAEGIQMQPDGARVFVACTPDDYVSIIDAKTLAVTGKLEVGKQPDGMAWVAGR